MKLIKVLCTILILLPLCQTERATNYNYQMRLTNRKQKKIIEGSLDLKANPCNNFYQYACGKWSEVFLEAGKKYDEPIAMIDYNVNKELSGVLDNFSTLNKPKFIQETYKYYKSCTNEYKYESNKYLEWLKINDQFKWPSLTISPKKYSIQYNWVKTLAKMRTYGLNNVFIQQNFLPGENDDKTFIIDLDKPVMNDGFEPLSLKDLKLLVESLPLRLNANTLDNLWLEIEEFEQKLQQLDEIADTEEDYENQRLIYAKDLPSHWLKDYLKIILNQTELNPNMRLYIQNIPYFNALNTLLYKYSHRFVCKYLKIRFIYHLFQQGPNSLDEEDCLENTRQLMPNAIHWLYEKEHPELLQESFSINTIFNNMRKHFKNTLTKNKYGFNTTVLHYLQNKINHMELRLNNVPRTNTISTLDLFYERLSLNEDKFYENHLKLLRFNFQVLVDALGPKVPVLDYSYLVDIEEDSSSSPYFLQFQNTIIVPLTLLQQPIYSPELDDIYKYSSLGFLIARTMFYGFDEDGIIRNSNGIMNSMNFEKYPLFKNSLNCLRELSASKINEKIVDISGLHYAYQAFFDAYPDARSKTWPLHGDEISSGKFFFLNFAQYFCGTDTFKESDDNSDQDKNRLIDAITNFPEFSKVFECSTNHLLYSHDACSLWR